MPELLKCNVLVVEDNAEMLLALRELLEAPDRNIVVAESGENALRAVLKNDFAVILLDIKMPNMDGFATARLIRKREGSRNSPIIFLTGADEDAVSSFRGYEVGAVDYLIKPMVPEVLRSKISVFIDLYRYNAALTREIAERRVIEEDLRKAKERLRAFAAYIESVRATAATAIPSTTACTMRIRPCAVNRAFLCVSTSVFLLEILTISHSSASSSRIEGTMS